MPIKKFRTFGEAEKDLWEFHPDKKYYQKVTALWRFASRLLPFHYPKGIFRYQTLEEAQKAKWDWIMKTKDRSQ